MRGKEVAGEHLMDAVTWRRDARHTKIELVLIK